MGMGRAIATLGLAAIIGAGAGYAVYEMTRPAPESARAPVESVAPAMDMLRKMSPEKYQSAKQYVIDDIASNPYDNIGHVRRMVDVAMKADQKETLLSIGRYYGREIQDIFKRGD
jgi:hypothetical protein